MKKPIRVAVTGPAGNIGYSLLFRIAAGDMFGPDQPVILQLLDRASPESQQKVTGVMMELDDCAFPLLAGLENSPGSDDRLPRRRCRAACRRPPSLQRDGAC